MKELINLNNQTLTMSSREIATLCGKEHKNVCRDIENLNAEYDKLSLLKIEQCEYVADNGQTYREFLLTKEQTIDLITGYRTDLRIRINRRWQELEQNKQVVALLPQTKLEALKAYVAEIEAHEQTKQHLTHQKECAKLENGKSIYGASLKQVNNKLNTNYHWKPLQQWCDDNDVFPETIYPNGYDSICVRVYPTQAWDDVYQVDLNQLFV